MLTRLKQDIKKAKLKVESKNKSEKSVEVSPLLNQETFSKKEINYFVQETDEKTIGYTPSADNGSQGQVLSLAIELDPSSTELSQTSITSNSAVTPETMSTAFSDRPFVSDAARNVQIPDALLQSPGYDINPFEGLKYSQGNTPSRQYTPSSAFGLIKKSIQLSDNLDFNILIHESSKLTKVAGNVDSTMLFLSKQSIFNNTFLTYKNRRIDKNESLLDNTLTFIDAKIYEENANLSVKSFVDTTISLDRLTTFNRKLEKTINYGNIVENFISTRKSKYNGKIINVLTERPNLYTYVVGGKDERLLDRQTQQINTRLKESLLTDFYYDVIDFYSLTDGDEDLSDSIVNQKIVNSDTICGQLMYNTSLSQYTVFPNSSEIISIPSWSTRRQEIIDRFKYLNNFPIIQVDNHFREQRDQNKFLYGKNNNHVLEISGNEFNINSILKNQRPVKVYRTEIPEVYSHNKFTLISKDYGNIETRYDHIRSLYGSIHLNSNSSTISRNYNNANIGLYIKRRGRNLLFDNLLLDVKPDETNPYNCMNFLILPERYFCSKSAQNLSLTGESDRIHLFDISNLFSDPGNIFSGNVSTGMSWPNDVSTYENEVADRFEENIFNKFNINSDNYGQFLSDVDDPYAEIKDIFENKFKDNISKTYSRNLRSYLRPYAKDADFRLSTQNNAVTYYFDVNLQAREDFYEEAFGEDNLEMFQSNLTEATLDKIYSSSGRDEIFESIFDQARDAGVSTIQREDSSFGSLDITDITGTRETFAGAVQGDISLKLRNERNWKSFISDPVEEDARNSISGVKTDCFVFEGSNAFISSGDLEKWSFNKKKLGENLIDLNYIKTTSERFLNKDNRSNTISLLYTNTNYHYVYSKICNAVNRIKRKNTPESVSNALKKFSTAGKKKIADSESYILLYDNFEETSIDTFENSKFISNNKYYKNNFAKSFSDIKNTSRAFSANEDFDGTHLFTSREYREYLSSIYTKSFTRDKTTLFNRIISDNIDIFESSSSYDTDQLFGFDVLFATALSNRTRESVDSVVNCVKLILVTSLAKLAGIENQISGLFEYPYRIKVGESIQDASINPSYIFSKKFSDLFGEENYKKIVTSIFTPKVVKEQKSFVLRSVVPPSADVLSRSFTSSSGLSDVGINFLPGKHVDLMFPFRSGVKDYGNSDNLKSAGSIKKTLGNAFTFDNNGDAYTAFVSELKNLSTVLAYNHDVFIDSSFTGVDYYEKNEDQKKVKAGWKFDESLEDIGTTLQISYLVNKFAHYNNSGSSTDDSLMPYKNISMTIPFSYFYLSDVQNTFSQKITQLAEDLFKVYEVDFSSINNISDAFDYVENNKVYAKVLQDILEVFSNIFLDSYNNYTSYLINYFNINQLSTNVSQKWKFVNGDNDLKKKSVDDLILIRDMILQDDNVEYIKSKKYDVNSYFDNNDLNVFYTPRIDYLQDVYQLLKNSDISDAIAHDIIHGYFANFEDNLANRNQDISDEIGIVSSINNKINAIEGIENFNISEYIDNEYYQNSLSKCVQEISFYKNLFKETFLENNLYNTLQEKYETSNLFNHRKTFVENKYILARQGIKTITDSFANQNFNNYDMICIPIDFMMANKLGEKALVEFSVLPVNLKYPEIEYKELKYYYSSFLTSVTSNYVSFLGEDIKDYIGFFEETEKISERYSVVSKIDMIVLLSDLIISKYKQRAIAEGENISGIDPGLGAIKIFNDMKMSSAIKDLNFVRQKHYDELVSVYSGNIENLISQNTSSMFRSIPNEKIKQMFEIESIQEILSNRSQYFNLGSNSDILENKEFYKKFLVDVDKEFSDTELVQAIIPNKYYDTFNFIVSRNNFEVADSQEEVRQRIDYSSLLRGTELGILTDQDTENYFVYYIGAKVL